MNDDNETCNMMNIDANVDDLKDYVGHHTSLSLETLTYCQGMFLANHIPQAIESGRDLYLLVFLFSHHRVRDF